MRHFAKLLPLSSLLGLILGHILLQCYLEEILALGRGECPPVITLLILKHKSVMLYPILNQLQDGNMNVRVRNAENFTFSLTH